MAPLVSLLLRRLALLFAELFTHFGMLAVRSYIWFKVAKFGWFMVKLGIFAMLIQSFVAGIEIAGNTISSSMPAMLSDGISRILPSNFYACVSALLTAKLMVFTLQVKDRALSLGGNL